MGIRYARYVGLEVDTIEAYLVDLSHGKRYMESMCGRKLQKSYSVNEEFIHIVEGLQNKLEDEDIELLEVVARNLWFMRNPMIYGGLFSHSTQFVRKASESLNDVKNANARTYESSESGFVLIRKWSMPTMYYTKIN